MVDAAVKVAPLCSCGSRMVEHVTDFYQCTHCDGPCHKRCDPAVCSEPAAGSKCAFCNAFDIGSRHKRDRNWHPPKAAA